jgi:hypothetical protein
LRANRDRLSLEVPWSRSGIHLHVLHSGAIFH